MFELVNKKRNNLKKNKKGFTLVEVIVVLVILAILAAILVPSMIGWINKANEKTAIVEARNALLALQTVASETYDPKDGTTDLDGVSNLSSASSTIKEDIRSLTDDKAMPDKVNTLKVISGKVNGFVYMSGDNKFRVTYNANASGSDKFVVTKR